jgi:hypothetical protein
MLEGKLQERWKPQDPYCMALAILPQHWYSRHHLVLDERRSFAKAPSMAVSNVKQF